MLRMYRKSQHMIVRMFSTFSLRELMHELCLHDFTVGVIGVKILIYKINSLGSYSVGKALGVVKLASTHKGNIL